MEVKVSYSSLVEAKSLLFAIIKYEQGYLKSLNMNVLPYVAKNRLHPTGVIIPKLNYHKMPNLLHESTKSLTLGRNGSFLDLKPPCINTLLKEIEQTYGNEYLQNFDQEKLESFMVDLGADLDYIFGKNYFNKVQIYIVRFGTGTISVPLTKPSSTLQICVREGVSISNITAAVMDAVTHLKKYELKLEHKELRPIRDWLISNTRIEHTLKKHKLNYRPSTTYMRKSTTDRFNRMDAKYLQSLELFTETLNFSLVADHIYFNKRCLVELTANEKKVLQILIENKSQIILYDTLLDVLEENNRVVSYYAVYKMIERLRLKLESLGIPSNVIKTVPKRGVYLAIN